MKELGKPKRPMSSFFLYCQTKKDLLPGKSLKEFQKVVREQWVNLSDDEKTKYEKQAQDLMVKYRYYI